MNQIKTLFVVSLLLLSACIPCVAAAGNDGRPQADKNIGQAPAADARAGPGGMMGDTAAEVKRAREMYLRDRTPENLEKLKDVEKDHFTQVIDTMIERLEVLQKRIKAAEDKNTMVPEGASDNIDKYIERLEEQKPNISAANTPDDIRAVARSIDMEWKSIRKEILHYTKFMIAVQIDMYIEKANNITDRLDARIAELGNDDVDTANMIQNLDEFKEKLGCVEENYKLAEDAIADDEINTGEVQQYIRNASSCIREANDCLGKVFREMRTLEGYESGDVSVSEDDEDVSDDSDGEADEDASDDSDEVADEDADTSGNETESETDTDDSANETSVEDDEDASTSGNETESETDDGDSANETTTEEDAGTSGNETDEATS